MSFTIKDYNLRDGIKTEKTLLTLSGFYPRKDIAGVYIWLYRFSAFLNLSISYGQLLSMIVQMAIDINNISKLTESLLFFMTHLTFLCKLFNFLYYRKKMFEIEDLLSETEFYGHALERVQILKNRVASCQTIAVIFRILCILCVIIYGIIPNLQSEETRTTPLPGWLPYDKKKYFHETVAYQVITVLVSAYNNSSIDILTCMLITLASGQVEILKENLLNIDYKTSFGNYRKVIEEKFTGCVKHHKAILRLSNQIEAMFSKGILLQFFASVLVICFTGFQMIVVPFPSLQFLLLVLYLSAMMCQVAMYCWFGHDVIATSDSISQNFYMSNWYEADIQIRKNILIFLERTKKPMVLTAGNFVVLSLETLMTILRSSYSYFAVLQRLYKNS